MHKRTQIRDRLEAVLTGLTTTTTSVFASRIANLASEDLPALKLYLMNEEASEDSSFGYDGIVSCEVKIECYVKTNSTFDSTLDLILEEVQAAVTADKLSGLRSLVKSIKYQGLEVEYEEGEQDLGRQIITYIAEYEQTL